jgi:hypothetical protein
MKYVLPLFVIAGALSLVACDRPAVVTVPAAPVAVPGPAGPAGATGATGATGDVGKNGTGATIVVTPPASAPAN